MHRLEVQIRYLFRYCEPQRELTFLRWKLGPQNILLFSSSHYLLLYSLFRSASYILPIFFPISTLPWLFSLSYRCTDFSFHSHHNNMVDQDGDQDDLALGEMIAESVKSLTAAQDDPGSTEEPEHENEAQDDDELDLQKAISQAMQSVQLEVNAESHASELADHETHTETDLGSHNENNIHETAGDDPQTSIYDNDDSSAAIEHALASVLMKEDTEKQQEDPGKDDNVEQVYEKDPEDNAHNEDELDDALTSAIGDALRSVSRYDETDDLVRAIGLAMDGYKDADTGKKTQEDDHEKPHEHHDTQDEHLNSVISSSLQQVLKHDHEDMDSAIADAFKSALREEDDISSIVQSIVSRAADTDISKETLRDLALEITLQVQRQEKEVPHIDDQVLAHFQKEAYQDHEHSEIDPELANLSRSSPAVEDPQKDPSGRRSSTTNALLAKILPSTTALFLELLDTSKDIDLKDKPLLIAETLARRRASMRPSGNAPGASNLLNTSGSVSSLISSLSSRIHAGGTNNLLQAIRQMTSTFSPAKTTTTDIILSMPTHEREDLVFRLVIAQRFLREGPAADLVARAIDLVRGPDQIPDMLQDSIENSVSSEMVAALDSSLNSALSTERKLFTAKPEIDSPEYKERIRLENRERKKRWREENAERNRDNDLRLRVLKRASLMFGDNDSPEKRAWAEEEFNRRKVKRLAKQQKEEDKPRDASRRPEKNPELTKPLHDVFNILSDLNTDSAALVPAVSACTATIASVYAFRSGTDLKTVEPAVLTTMAQLMEKQRIRWGELLKPEEPEPKRYRPNYKSDENSMEIPHLQTHEPQAPHYVQHSLPLSTSVLSHHARPLRMPSYRPKDSPELTRLSPFLSNKQGRLEAPKGLRKPGSFQRPQKMGRLGTPPVFPK